MQKKTMEQIEGKNRSPNLAGTGLPNAQVYQRQHFLVILNRLQRRF